MPIYYEFQGSLLSEDQYVKEVANTAQARARVTGVGHKGVRQRSVVPRDAKDETSQLVEPGAFSAIGIGKPLVIWVTSAYAGDLPAKGFFGGDRGGLLTSAVKSWSYQDAQPRALNCIKQKVAKRQEIVGAGNEPGT